MFSQEQTLPIRSFANWNKEREYLKFQSFSYIFIYWHFCIFLNEIIFYIGKLKLPFSPVPRIG
jgi:hypothetical protein